MRKRWSQQNLLLNLLFGLGYFLLAKLGFIWGALALNASLIWPPSGLAVFAWMVFGRRIVPGLLIGAIAANQIVSLAPVIGYSWSSWCISTLNAVGSMLQTLVIMYWMRKAYALRFRMSPLTNIRLVALVLASCTIAASIDNLVLWQANIINTTTALHNWGIWWLGDAIGVLIVTPLLLWLYKRTPQTQHTQANAFYLFCAGIGAVLLIVAAIGHSERLTQQKNLTQEVTSLRLILQANIDQTNRNLDTLQAFFPGHIPSRDEFKNFTEPLLTQNDWIDAYTWLPLVNSTRKALQIDYANGLRLRRDPNNHFLWQSPDSNPLSAAQVQGFSTDVKTGISDIIWRPSANSTLENTPVISLAEAIYACEGATKNHCRLTHIVSNDINLNRLMSAAIAQLNLQGLDIRLAPTSNTQGQQLVWDVDHWQPAPNRASPNSFMSINHELPSLKWIDREWLLLVSPPHNYHEFIPSLLQISVLCIGGLLVGLIFAYLQALQRQEQMIIENQQRLEQEIQRQTESLQLANQWLLKEVEEHRITQQRLTANEGRLRTLLDNIPDPVWYKSTGGEYLNINKMVEKLWGKTEAALLGKRSEELFDEEAGKAISAQDSKALANNSAVREQHWLYVPHFRRKRLLDILKIAVRNAANNPIGVLSIARDITEQHQLIDELEKFKRFSEYASDGFAIISLRAKILYMNRSMTNMLALEHDEKNADLLDYLPPTLHSEWQNQILPHLLLHGSWKGELEARRYNGTSFPTKETLFVIRDEKGHPQYFGKVMRDISEQKQIQSALQFAKDAAEEATQAKSRFLANMSHEIRTPLNAILGYAQLLMAEQQVTPQQQERMSAIINAGQRLLHLINDILDLSKIEAGALQLRSDYFDLRQELSDILSLMQAKATAKGLILSARIDLPAPAIVKSDRQKIGQIILNLLGNAIKFTAQGEVSFYAYMEGDGIGCTITDTGPGIAPQELQALFSSFRQGKAGEDSGGTGLGLTISKHIAESLGGRLQLESELGQGTRAHLHLPLLLEQNTHLAGTAIEAQLTLAPDSRCKLLVVEDDNASRDVLVKLLEKIGCEVTAATNGSEGLTAIQRDTFDLVFTDIRMPALSGDAMLRQVRQTTPAEQLPIIAVSASNLEHERSFYLAQGFQDFIGKPYQFQDIYRALKQFTQAEFLQNSSTIALENTANDNAWQQHPDLGALRQQLQELQQALHDGDMQTSKKLFAQQSADTLGSNRYRQLQQAIKQYDLDAAATLIQDLQDGIAAKQAADADNNT